MTVTDIHDLLATGRLDDPKTATWKAMPPPQRATGA
jgi:hypothetical protein